MMPVMDDTTIKQWTYVAFFLKGAISLKDWAALDERARTIIREEIDELNKRIRVPL
jgi:hypothetical protein